MDGLTEISDIFFLQLFSKILVLGLFENISGWGRVVEELLHLFLDPSPSMYTWRGSNHFIFSSIILKIMHIKAMYSNFNKGQEQLQTKIFSSQNLNLRTVKKKTDYQKCPHLCSSKLNGSLIPMYTVHNSAISISVLKVNLIRRKLWNWELFLMRFKCHVSGLHHVLWVWTSPCHLHLWH